MFNIFPYVFTNTFNTLVNDTDLIDIPTEKRAEWIKQLYPNIEIKFAHNPPKQYGLDEESVNIQMEYLTKIIEEDDFK